MCIVKKEWRFICAIFAQQNSLSGNDWSIAPWSSKDQSQNCNVWKKPVAETFVACLAIFIMFGILKGAQLFVVKYRCDSITKKRQGNYNTEFKRMVTSGK